MYNRIAGGRIIGLKFETKELIFCGKSIGVSWRLLEIKLEFPMFEDIVSLDCHNFDAISDENGFADGQHHDV